MSSGGVSALATSLSTKKYSTSSYPGLRMRICRNLGTFILEHVSEIMAVIIY